jgi:hypothetical protein
VVFGLGGLLEQEGERNHRDEEQARTQNVSAMASIDALRCIFP